MRDLQVELEKIIDFARNSDNIRAVVFQGSYVNPNVTLDEFSDLDPLFYVRNVEEFVENDVWKRCFGNPISEFNDEGESYEGEKWYTRLTIFSDGFKIDFGFQSTKLAKYANEMPLYKVYLDKDGIVPKPETEDERKFFVVKPSEREFLDRINEFYYDTSYIAKALIRNEIFFVKYMESVLQKKIRILLEWYIGLQYDFQVNTGIKGRYFRRYLNDADWNLLMKTYADGNNRNIAVALFASYDLVGHIGRHLAKELGYSFPNRHESDMLVYCHQILDKLLEGNS